MFLFGNDTTPGMRIGFWTGYITVFGFSLYSFFFPLDRIHLKAGYFSVSIIPFPMC